MRFSTRFLNLLQSQLSEFAKEPELGRLVVYVASNTDGENPSLEAIGQWPLLEKSLPSVESDVDLRSPLPGRRWYPLQEGQILLGVLRVEAISSTKTFSSSLDSRLQLTASFLAQSLAIELDRKSILEELNQQREQIKMMVHQLRNPLAALRTYAQLLLRKLGPESSHINLIEGLLNEQDQLNKYISALDEINYSKLPSSSFNHSPLLLPPVLPKAKSLNIRSMVQPLIDRASATAALQGRIWNSPSEWPRWMEAERPPTYGVVAEIVANLLENAFRYSPTGSSIGIAFFEDSLCVWDGGPSIALNDRDQIFEKGYRGKNIVKTSGSGLGLSLARQLAEDIGGSLDLVVPPAEIDESLPFKGNAFLLNLPIKELQD